jgi:hypothetical protein
VLTKPPRGTLSAPLLAALTGIFFMGVTINIQWLLFLLKVLVITFFFKTGYLIAATIVLAPSFIREVFRAIYKREPMSFKVLFLAAAFIIFWVIAAVKYDNLYKYGID